MPTYVPVHKYPPHHALIFGLSQSRDRDVKDVSRPDVGGAEPGSIFGAYIFNSVLHEAGYAIVPLSPTPRMKACFRRGWFRDFRTRYAAMLDAS